MSIEANETYIASYRLHSIADAILAQGGACAMRSRRNWLVFISDEYSNQYERHKHERNFDKHHLPNCRSLPSAHGFSDVLGSSFVRRHFRGAQSKVMLIETNELFASQG